MANFKTRKLNHTWVGEGGELHIVETSSVVNIGSDPPFAKMYLSHLGNMFRLPSQMHDVLVFIVSRMEYEKNTISISAGTKREMCNMIRIFKKGTEEPSLATINNILSGLTDRGLIKRIDTGMYFVNPFIFGSGSWDKIKKMRQVIEFTPEGTMTFIEPKTDNEND